MTAIHKCHGLRFLCFISLVGLSLQLSAQDTQKKRLDHEDLDRWKEIEQAEISANGRWVAYELKPNLGDSEVFLYDADTEYRWSYPRGSEPRISRDNRFAAFFISPPLDSLKAMRRRGTEKEDLPPDTLAVLDLQRRELTKIPDVASFRLPEKWAGWIVFERKETSDADKDALKSKKQGNIKTCSLVFHNLDSGAERVVESVTDYTLAEEVPRILVASAGNDSTMRPGVFLFDGREDQLQPLLQQKGTYTQLALDRQGERAAFLADLDTTQARVRPYGLYFWRQARDSARLVADNSAGILPEEDWRISEHGKVYFAEDGSRLFFGTAPLPVLEDTTLLEEEIVQVEVWSYRDKRLYTQREVMKEEEQKQTYLAVWHIDENKFVALGDEALPEIRVGNEGKSRIALGLDETPYLQKSSWEGFPVCKDVYLVDLITGRRTRIAEQVCGEPALSPEATYAYWYSYPDSAWYAYSIEREELTQLTSNEQGPFYDELNDRPMHPSPYGIAGWTVNDGFILIYDRYDIWLIDPAGNVKSNNLTRGRADNRSYRYIKLDPEERAIDEVAELLFHYVDEDTKEEGYAWYDIHAMGLQPVQGGDYSYTRRVKKAKEAERYLFTRENFQTFPDLLYSEDELKAFTRISEANPQQSEYLWGTAELYHWTDANGQRLDGIVVKPEDFDPEKKYPAIVYFYERNSDNLHRHRAPEPHRSIINFTFYASRGYVIFIPDIPYQIGYPGKSAYDAVMPGIGALLEEGYIDRARIGVQGHSWGGYQVAYLVTQTNLFRCAESGAPVVNMISAYGGIRWGSGLSRMFQYERTQSRIGGTLWEYPMRYIENSPIFYIDKVQTPVLILHNDQDGAVPWYQGIEFFVAMRRLGKPAWLLNYNEEPHWPLKYQNRKDFQRRMQQFFDHYLQEAPRPLWMEEGVPPLKKGIEQGFEPAEKTIGDPKK